MSTVTKAKLQRLDSLAAGSERPAVVVHTHPDGDAVGSGMALVSYLRGVRGKKDAVLVVPDPYPDSLEFLVEEGSVVVASETGSPAADLLAAADLLFCLDFNSVGRTGGLQPLLEASSAPKVLIDHHLDADPASFELAFSDTGVSSTCELLFRILSGMPEFPEGRLPVDMGTPLMVGMTTDTNNFANSVYPSTLTMASELLASGVDRGAILSHLYNELRENRFRAMGHFLADLMKISPGGVAYAVMDAATLERFDLREGETDGFVNMPLGIDRVVMSVFLREDEGFFRVSVRSKPGFSANGLARLHFHGGGHECAAGGRLFFPADIPAPGAAEEYIERVTARFLQDTAPSKK